jgi:CRP/FNR family transcriptional regulator, cyclic AMP receptor protein
MAEKYLALTRETVVGVLEGLDWLSPLSAGEIALLADKVDVVEWEAGETVFEEGETGDCCYVVYRGAVKVVRRLPDGRRIALARLTPGTVFGELALFASERRSATVQVVEPTVAIVLAAPDVMSILSSSPQASLGMTVTLANRLRATNERLLEYALASTSGRVIATVLSQVESRQSMEPGERDIEVIGSAADVAKLAGASKESALRVLHSLENDGIISIKRGKMIVHDPDALRDYLL